MPWEVGDLDDDGYEDVAFRISLDTWTGEDVDERIALVSGRELADGTDVRADDLAAALILEGSSTEAIAPIAATDIDGDGRADLAVVWQDRRGDLTVVLVPAQDLLTGAGVAIASAPVVFDLDEVSGESGESWEVVAGPDFAGGFSMVRESEDDESGRRTVRIAFGR